MVLSFLKALSLSWTKMSCKSGIVQLFLYPAEILNLCTLISPPVVIFKISHSKPAIRHPLSSCLECKISVWFQSRKTVSQKRPLGIFFFFLSLVVFFFHVKCMQQNTTQAKIEDFLPFSFFLSFFKNIYILILSWQMLIVTYCNKTLLPCSCT